MLFYPPSMINIFFAKKSLSFQNFLQLLLWSIFFLPKKRLCENREINFFWISPHSDFNEKIKKLTGSRTNFNEKSFFPFKIHHFSFSLQTPFSSQISTILSPNLRSISFVFSLKKIFFLVEFLNGSRRKFSTRAAEIHWESLFLVEMTSFNFYEKSQIPTENLILPLKIKRLPCNSRSKLLNQIISFKIDFPPYKFQRRF